MKNVNAVPHALAAAALDAARAWIDRDASRMGASIAFYAIFALAPSLVVIVWIAGAAFGSEAAQAFVFQQLSRLLGEMAATLALAVMQAAQKAPAAGGIAAWIAVATLLIGAVGVFAEMSHALNEAWGRKPSTWRVFLRAPLATLALLLGFGFVAVASLLLSTAVEALGRWAWGGGGAEHFGLRVLDVAANLIVMTLAFAMLLRGLVARAPPLRAIAIGAVATSVLFLIGQKLLALYLAHSAMASAYGAAGALVVVVLWIYYSAQIFLYGAMYGRAADRRLRQARGSSADSVSTDDPAAASDAEESTGTALAHRSR